MEVFEVHITGDESIHAAAQPLGLKTIAIDLLKPDGTVLRTEHMTSHVCKFPDYAACKASVDQAVADLKSRGVGVVRVKIESPYYEHYRERSLYMEAHFESYDMELPTSRNQKKATLLATNREYEDDRYDAFRRAHENDDIELCLHDTFVAEDKDWFHCYGGA
jgi:hypothetical protein